MHSYTCFLKNCGIRVKSWLISFGFAWGILVRITTEDSIHQITLCHLSFDPSPSVDVKGTIYFPSGQNDLLKQKSVTGCIKTFFLVWICSKVKSSCKKLNNCHIYFYWTSLLTHFICRARFERRQVLYFFHIFFVNSCLFYTFLSA